jgi:hypothetical protein
VLSAYNANAGPVWLVESLGEPVNINEDFTATGQAYRTQAWQLYLSGGWGGYTHLQQSPPPEPYPNPTAGTEDLRRLREFFMPLAWSTLEPSQGPTMVPAGGGTVGNVLYKPRALNATGTLGVVYVPDGTSVTIDLARFTGAVRARWYDPTSGEYTTVAGSPFANSGTRAFVASSTVGANDGGAADWVLLLERN